MTTGDRLMTADDLLSMPDDGNRYELARGRLVCVSPASSRSSLVSRRLGTYIDIHVMRHKLGICGDPDWGMRLASNPDIVRAPDVGFVRAERVPASGIPDGFWPGAPDLAVEVISPTDRYGDVIDKAQEYLVAGTLLVWLVDPERRTVVIFRQAGATSTIGAEGVLDGEDVLPGFRLNLSEIWV